MLIEAAGRFSSTVKTRYNLPIHVHHLALPINPQASATIVHKWRRPSGVKGRGMDLILGRRLAEVGVYTGVHKRVVAVDRCLQGGAVHGLRLIWILDRCG